MKLKPYPQYKDSGIEWLGEVPEHWLRNRIKYVSKVLNGSTPSSSEPDYWDGDISWATPDDLGSLNSKYLYETKRQITEEGYLSCGTTIAPSNSVVLSTRAPIGHIAISENAVCCNQGCRILVPCKNVLSDYLYYLLYSSKSLLEALGQGSTFKELNRDTLTSFELPYPSLEDQQAIAAFLDRETSRIDALIQKKERLIELLKEKRIALITQAVTKGLDPNVPMKDSGIEWLGEVPEHWEVKKMKHIGKALIGLTYSPDDVVFDEGVLVLRSSNIQDGKLVTGTDDVYVTTTIPQKIVIKQFDILICSRNGSRSLIGKSAIIDSPDLIATFGAFMSVFRSDINDYVIWVLQSNMFSSLCSGYVTSTINQLTQSDLSNLTIPLPPREEQSSISRFLSVKTSEMDDLLKTTIKSISLLREYRSSLINAAVTGKIDLREAL